MLCFLAALAYNQVQLGRIGASLEVVNRVYLPIARQSARMVGLVERERMGQGTLDTALAEARALAAGTATLHPDIEERAALKAAAQQIEDVAAALAAWRTSAGTESEAGARAALRNKILQLSTLVEGRVAASSEKAASAQTRARNVSAGLLAVAVLIGALLLWLTGAALLPISTLTEQVRRVAAGERPGPMPETNIEEIRTLARAFDQMVRAVDERDRHLHALSLYLRRVLDNIAAAVAVVEGDVVRMANPAAHTLWGLQEGEPLPTPLAPLPHGRHENLHVGERLQDVIVRPFGEHGTILLGEDVTERQRDRERLQRSERLALVGQMLAQVTHEVRNPLNAISLHAELLAEEVEGEEARSLLDTIITEIRRLEGVTERYLDLARRRLPETSPEDPVALARGVVGLEEEALRRAGVTAEVTGGPLPTVEMDGDTVRRALLNLLRNAGEAGAHHIRVHVQLDARTLEFEVHDDGPGMDPSVAERVFDPFFSTRVRGTGLGLAIARQSLEDLGGSLSCETAPGAGTIFRVRLPA
ncbi:MAG: ATP-binding protein [Pseudomonadota bacterium]|nr:ATP-binding protein [Pseudomonadota bacterium]